jgi:hypothetical protein
MSMAASTRSLIAHSVNTLVSVSNESHRRYDLDHKSLDTSISCVVLIVLILWHAALMHIRSATLDTQTSCGQIKHVAQ